MLQVYLEALTISFLGQLPFGNMNLTATQLAVQEGLKNAWKYSIGIVIVELLYLRLALTAMDWIVANQLVFAIMGWVTVALFLALGILSVFMARKQSPDKKGLLLNNKLDRFVLGVTVSAINPAQIPFWFIWSTGLVNSGMLQINTSHFNFFTAGAVAGSIAGLAVYIYGGKWLIVKMKASNKKLNIFMGVVFILAALMQIYNMLFRDIISHK